LQNTGNVCHDDASETNGTNKFHQSFATFLDEAATVCPTVD
jgi:hypothetical protein